MTASTRSLGDWGYENMSYQQFPPVGGPNGPGDPGAPQSPLGQPPLGLPPLQQPAMQQPAMQQPGEPFAPTSAGGRRAGLIGVGALLAASGLVAGTVLFLASSSNYDEGVQNLARAPIGCTTSLEFDESGTYTIYVETRGEIADLRGDCSNDDADYDFGDVSDASDLPDVDIVLVDDRGDEVDLDNDDSKDYDAAGFIGRSVSSVEIAEAGDYEITATSDDDEFAIAIGRNPQATAASMKTMAIVALVVGVVLGGLCIVFGMRRRPAAGADLPPGPGSGSANPAPVYQAPLTAAPPMPPAPPAPPAGGASWPAPPGA